MDTCEKQGSKGERPNRGRYETHVWPPCSTLLVLLCLLSNGALCGFVGEGE